MHYYMNIYQNWLSVSVTKISNCGSYKLMCKVRRVIYKLNPWTYKTCNKKTSHIEHSLRLSHQCGIYIDLLSYYLLSIYPLIFFNGNYLHSDSALLLWVHTTGSVRVSLWSLQTQGKCSWFPLPTHLQGHVCAQWMYMYHLYLYTAPQAEIIQCTYNIIEG